MTKFNGGPTRPGEYLIKVDGFTVDTIVPESIAANQAASFVRRFGADKVLMLDYEGAAMSLTAALQGRLEVA
jgi:hypothetical protein